MKPLNVFERSHIAHLMHLILETRCWHQCIAIAALCGASGLKEFHNVCATGGGRAGFEKRSMGRHIACPGQRRRAGGTEWSPHSTGASVLLLDIRLAINVGLQSLKSTENLNEDQRQDACTIMHVLIVHYLCWPKLTNESSHSAKDLWVLCILNVCLLISPQDEKGVR